MLELMEILGTWFLFVGAFLFILVWMAFQEHQETPEAVFRFLWSLLVLISILSCIGVTLHRKFNPHIPSPQEEEHLQVFPNCHPGRTSGFYPESSMPHRQPEQIETPHQP